MSNHSEKSSLSSDLTGESTEKLSTSKRTMLKFAWTAPLVMAIALPTSSFASNVSGLQDSDGKGNDSGQLGTDPPRFVRMLTGWTFSRLTDRCRFRSLEMN